MFKKGLTIKVTTNLLGLTERYAFTDYFKLLYDEGNKY